MSKGNEGLEKWTTLSKGCSEWDSTRVPQPLPLPLQPLPLFMASCLQQVWPCLQNKDIYRNSCNELSFPALKSFLASLLLQWGHLSWKSLSFSKPPGNEISRAKTNDYGLSRVSAIFDWALSKPHSNQEYHFFIFQKQGTFVFFCVDSFPLLSLLPSVSLGLIIHSFPLPRRTKFF